MFGVGFCFSVTLPPDGNLPGLKPNCNSTLNKQTRHGYYCTCYIIMLHQSLSFVFVAWTNIFFAEALVRDC